MSQSTRVEIFKKIHAYDILDRNIREEDLWLSNQNWEEAIEYWKTGGPGYTIIINDEIVACGGIFLLGRSGEAWTLLSPLFYKYYRLVYRIIKSKVSEMIQEYKLNRVQATIKPDFAPAIRLVEHLGFEKEGIMKSYGPNGEDVLLYGRTQ